MVLLWGRQEIHSRHVVKSSKVCFANIKSLSKQNRRNASETTIAASMFTCDRKPDAIPVWFTSHQDKDSRAFFLRRFAHNKERTVLDCGKTAGRSFNGSLKKKKKIGVLAANETEGEI